MRNHVYLFEHSFPLNRFIPLHDSCVIELHCSHSVTLGDAAAVAVAVREERGERVGLIGLSEASNAF